MFWSVTSFPSSVEVSWIRRQPSQEVEARRRDCDCDCDSCDDDDGDVLR